MWLISFLPFAMTSFLLNVVMIVAVAALILSYVLRLNPYVAAYSLPIRIISILTLFVCTYYNGALDQEKKWKDKVDELEQKVELAEQFSKEKNKEIEIRYVTKVKRVKETQYVIQEKIKEVEKVIDAQCKVAPQAISILNEAAKDPK